MSLYSEQEANVQEKLWMLGLIEMHLSQEDALHLLESLSTALNEMESNKEIIVLHFGSESGKSSAIWERMNFTRITQLLDYTIVDRKESFTKLKKLKLCREYIEYQDTVYGNMKE